MQGATNPLHMRLMVSQKIPEAAVRQSSSHPAETNYLSHHEEHHKTPVGIERCQALRRVGINRFLHGVFHYESDFPAFYFLFMVFPSY